MRKFVCVLLVCMVVLGLSISATASPAKDPIITTATGCIGAEDVVYVTYTQSGREVIANWGARGETCSFLTTYAESFYTDGYGWEDLSALSGGTGTGDAYTSALYAGLQELMAGAHSFYTYYDGSKNVRDFYCYTDCVSSDISQVALLYRGGLKTSEWNSGNIWNQEHVWPKSKLTTDKQIGDIMHLRPANPSENSSRGNKSYGESSGFYDPGVSVRGDCARMVLYMYVRWGVTDTMWGSDGVIENLEILLRWIQEDPVDTWEMGRNDSVQSITGTRNVFVDYPEYAFLLFGEEIPEDMVTPSGQAGEKPCAHENLELRNAREATCTEFGYTGDTYCTVCGEMVALGQDIPATGHRNTQLWNQKNATCGESGYTGDTYCLDCNMLLAEGEVIPATGAHTFDADGRCKECGYVQNPDCSHENVALRNAREATCTEFGYTGDTYCTVCGEMVALGQDIPATGHRNTQLWNQKNATCGESGYTGDTYCVDCNMLLAEGKAIPATGAHTFDEDGRCKDCGYVQEPGCSHENVTCRNNKEATCGEDGHTGDVYCADCGEFIAGGSVIPATGEHTFGEWTAEDADGYMTRSCTVCGDTQRQSMPQTTPVPGENNDPLWLMVAAAGVVVIVLLLLLKKKKK